MRRPALAFFMLMAVLWQAMAIAPVGPSVSFLADPEHAALHLQEAGHHHHEDGSFHLDDSRESLQHVLSDNVNALAVLPVSPPRDFVLHASRAPGGWHDAPPPGPYLEAPLRPPRRHS